MSQLKRWHLIVIFIELHSIASYETITHEWFDNFVFSDDANNGWRDIGNYCSGEDSVECLDDNPVTQGSLNKYHGPYRAFGGDGVHPIHELSQRFYCEHLSDVTISYKIASCSVDIDNIDHYGFFIDDNLIEVINQTVSDTRLNDDTLNEQCSPWYYAPKTWTNIASVSSNQLFKPKWTFSMNAKDYYVVYDIQIICDGTANPTSNPSESPSTYPSTLSSYHPSIVPTSNPSVSPTNNPSIFLTETPSISPTNEPTVEPTNNPTIEPTYNPSIKPTEGPSFEPSMMPSVYPSLTPTTEPTNSQISKLSAITAYPSSFNQHGLVDELASTIDVNIENKDESIIDESKHPLSYIWAVNGGLCGVLCVICGIFVFMRRKHKIKMRIKQTVSSFVF